jgi:ubiquinone/menaquinone biosynthesis C-methylase UbiE
MLEEKKKMNNIQVDDGHYTRRKYNSLERFISFYYQIDSVVHLNDVEKILEVGPGGKLVTENLRLIGYDVTTCDFDIRINPDIVSDIRSLPFEQQSFDCILVCQVLEHIPFDDFKKVVEDLAKITKRYVIVSLPQRSSGFEIVIKTPFIQSIFKKRFFDLSLQFPIRFMGFKESDQHYWEIDWFTTKKKDVENVLEKHFSIKKTFRPPLNKYHRFYILEKKYEK